MATNKVYYGICPNCPADFKDAATVEVVGNQITFSAAQTSVLMGVGAKVTYNGANVGYISGKISSTVWTMTSATGGNPTAVGAGTALNSITHPFTSLSLAEAGSSGASFLNNADITAAGANVDLYWPQYQHDTNDTTAVTIAGYTTDATHQIYIYCPESETTECNAQQANTSGGTWDATKPNLTVAVASGQVLRVTDLFVDVYNMQLYNSHATDNNCRVVWLEGTDATAVHRFYRNIVRAVATDNGDYRMGVYLRGNFAWNCYVYNNMIYIVNNLHTGSAGVRVSSAIPTVNIYGNTIYGWAIPQGVADAGATFISYNNAFIGNQAISVSIGTYNHDYNCYDINESETHGRLTTQTDAQLFTLAAGGLETWDFTPNGTISDLIGNSTKAGKDDLGSDYSGDFANDTEWRPKANYWDFGALETNAVSAPSVDTQPENQTIKKNKSATFSIEASGTEILTYQWRKDEVNISGATESEYNIPNVLKSDMGSYDCVVTNDFGSAISDDGELIVLSGRNQINMKMSMGL